MKKMREWTKKQKWTLTVTGLLIVGGVGAGAYKVYADSVKEKNIAEMHKRIKMEDQKIDTIKARIQALYSDHEKGYLVSDISEDELLNLQNDIKKLNTVTITVSDKTVEARIKSQDQSIRDLEKSYELLYYQARTQGEVNKLFSNPAIDGSKVNKELAIADDCKKEDVEKVLSDTKIIDGSFLVDSEWFKSIEVLKQSALGQLKQIEVATQKVNAMFDKENVKADVNQDSYNQAQGEVDKIKNEKAKKNLNDRLAKVAKKLEEKAQAEKQKAEAEQAQQQQEQATVSGGTTDNGIYSGEQSSSSNTYSGGDYSSNNAGGGYYSGNNSSSSGGGSNQGSVSTPSGGSNAGGNNNHSSGSTSGSGTIVVPNENGGEDIYEGWD